MIDFTKLTFGQWLAIIYTTTGIITLWSLVRIHWQVRLALEGAKKRKVKSPPEIIMAERDRRTAWGRVIQQSMFVIVGLLVLFGPVLFPGVAVGGIALTVALLWTQYWYLYSARRNNRDNDKLDVYLKPYTGTTERRASEKPQERRKGDKGTNIQG